MHRVDKIHDLRHYVPPASTPTFDFLELDPGTSGLPPQPLFLFGPAAAIVHQELFGEFETPPVGCYRLAEGSVAASGIPVQHDTAFTAPSLLHPNHLVSTVAGHMSTHALIERHVEGELAVIYGPGYQTYGHWLADFLPRLWVLEATGHDIEKIAYAMPADIDSGALDLLHRIGIPPTHIVTHNAFVERLTADMLLVPTGCRLGNRMNLRFENATKFWTDRLHARTGRCVPPAAGRLFLSRGKVRQQRTLVNRDIVEAIAAERGFVTIAPESLKFTEQLSLFTNASLIVGEYGSALHGAVFSAPGTVVCGLRGNVRHPSFIQSGIGAALRQHTGYVLGDAPGQDIEQRFSIDTADFERALDIMEVHLAMTGQAAS